MLLTSYKKTLSIMLMMLSPLTLFAEIFEGDVFIAYELRDFKNSTFKDDGSVAVIGTKIQLDNSHIRAIYSYTDTNTIKPPMTEDLVAKKLALKYAYKLDDWKFSAYYLNILDDNIAPTSSGAVYALGITYNITKQTSLGLAGFRTEYDKFNVCQRDLIIEHKTKFNDVKVKFASITKYISIDKYNNDLYSKNAKDNYLTSGLTIHSHYQTYHFGIGAYFGKRAFAIMNDGTRVQHHALEFDETYAIGAGKTFDKLTLKVQYLYLGAYELPADNGIHVKVDVINFMGSYKF